MIGKIIDRQTDRPWPGIVGGGAHAAAASGMHEIKIAESRPRKLILFNQ